MSVTHMVMTKDNGILGTLSVSILELVENGH